MMKRSRGTAEIAVMEVAPVGVTTRAQALDKEAAADNASEISGAAKKRKVDECDGELRFGSTSYVQLRGKRRVVVSGKKSVSPPRESRSDQRTLTEGEKETCSTAGSDREPVSCCSSNGSSEERDGNRTAAVDLEDEIESAKVETSTHYCGSERIFKREMTPSSGLKAEPGELESTVKPTQADSRRTPPAEKMPTNAEIEEFFSAAEKNLLQRFTEKYNFDFVKEEPLEGRYEWLRIKP